MNLIDPSGMEAGCGTKINDRSSTSCNGSYSPSGRSDNKNSSAQYHERTTNTPQPTQNSSTQRLETGEVIDLAEADIAIITTVMGGVRIVYSAGKGILRNLTGASLSQPTPALINQAHHIFGESKHNLTSVLKKFGNDPIKATIALNKAAQKYISRNSITGRFTETIKFGGANVTIRGTVIDDVAKVSTAYVP